MTRAERYTAALLFAAGTLCRYVYLFIWHRATHHVYSDMQGYVEWAQRFFRADRAPSIMDTFHPPGTPILFGLLYELDSSWSAAITAQWLMSIGIMVLVFQIARLLYDARVALVALGITAFYLPFIHYAGVFLADNPFTFFLLVAFLLFVYSTRATRLRHATLLAVAAGVTAGFAASFKNAILGSLIVTGVGFAVLAWRHAGRVKILCIGLGATLGLALVFAPMAVRCTRLNEGRFCLAATNTACNVLMGHYGKKAMFHWHDTARGIEIGFGSPTAAINGYTVDVDLPFGVYDSDQNMQLAVQWIRDNPGAALEESFLHILELFKGVTLWPLMQFGTVDYGRLAQQLYWWLVLLPGCLWLARRARLVVRLRYEAQSEVLLLLPLVGLMGVVFLSIAEVRYRVPFDGFMIILAAKFYVCVVSWTLGVWQQRQAHGISPS